MTITVKKDRFKVLKEASCTNCGIILEYEPSDANGVPYTDKVVGGQETHNQLRCPRCQSDIKLDFHGANI